MAVPVMLMDGRSGKKARITNLGQLVTSPLSYDLTKNHTIDSTDTAFNFFGPKAGKNFVVTGLVMTANKNINTDVRVEFYGALGPDDVVGVGESVPIEMLRSSSRDILGLNILVSEGIWINVKADDIEVNVTMFGYYVDATS